MGLTVRRKEGESIWLKDSDSGNEILITIEEFEHYHGRIRAVISIEAPKAVLILREELRANDGNNSHRQL